MMPIFRIVPRVSNISAQCVFASTQASSRPFVQRVSPAVFGQSDTLKAMDNVWNRNRSIVEGFQGDTPEFSLSEARRVLSLATEYQAEGPGVQGVQENYSVSALTHEGGSQQNERESFVTQDVHSDVYSGLDRHVSLGSCLQGNVPHPHQYNMVPGYGSHMNMPGSGGTVLDKYASASMQICHPSRHFSTSTRARSNVQGAVHVEIEDLLLSDPAPQGIQGDNCVNFKLWMENCQRYNLPNCDEQLESIKAGRKTLAQVFQEQQEIIQKVTADYKKQQLAARQSASNAQGLQDSSYNYQFSIDDPCPQGLQGEACANYKFWAYNCKAFGFGDCLEKSDDIVSGRRSLHDVFTEQDVLIRKIVNDYKQKRNYSTDSSRSSGGSSEVGKSDTPGSASENISPSHSTPPNDNKENDLSQRAKLKRAVKEYGGTVIVFHVGISLLSLGGFYAAVSSGLDVVGLLAKLGVGESILQSRLATGSTTFVVAYAVHKVFAPVRIAITLTCTPLIVRHLRKIGFLKPPKVN